MAAYDRYAMIRNASGDVTVFPFIKIPTSGSDIHIRFNKRTMRMDTLSYKYYGDPDYGWLIMQANPQYGGYEYALRDGITLRIPYPLSTAINGYENSVKAALNLN